NETAHNFFLARPRDRARRVELHAALDLVDPAEALSHGARRGYSVARGEPECGERQHRHDRLESLFHRAPRSRTRRPGRRSQPPGTWGSLSSGVTSSGTSGTGETQVVSSPRGSVSLKLLPSPGRDQTSSRPPCTAA